MELAQIRHFIAVVETGSFTKAALREAVSQPAISASIAKLEAELAVQLLDRRRSSAVATPAGMRLVEAGRSMLHISNTVKAELKTFSKPKLLRIGILRTLSSQRVSKLLSSFRRASPCVAFEVFDGSNDQLAEFLSERKVDAVLTILDGHTAKYKSRVLFKEPFFLAVPEDHRFARQRSVQLSQLHDEPFIVRAGYDRFEDGAKALISRGVKIRVVYQTDEFDRAVALVAARIGLALIPARFEIPAVKLLSVSELDVIRTYGFLWLYEREDHDLEEFINFAESHGWAP